MLGHTARSQESTTFTVRLALRLLKAATSFTAGINRMTLRGSESTALDAAQDERCCDRLRLGRGRVNSRNTKKTPRTPRHRPRPGRRRPPARRTGDRNRRPDRAPAGAEAPPVPASELALLGLQGLSSVSLQLRNQTGRTSTRMRSRQPNAVGFGDGGAPELGSAGFVTVFTLNNIFAKAL